MEKKIEDVEQEREKLIKTSVLSHFRQEYEPKQVLDFWKENGKTFSTWLTQNIPPDQFVETKTLSERHTALHGCGFLFVWLKTKHSLALDRPRSFFAWKIECHHSMQSANPTPTSTRRTCGHARSLAQQEDFVAD